ncbi:hypothetical protein Clacol_000010 [Clathrus columnatus]|uniref:Major facilitator superfamily (MFS) profile domain-containing protein n=1 Tax=Clathrus columnatus TaxID=1419009 RepID=A0AAV4ZXN4_9AGAM|nr:hypothetical protein Clacol_000010 [Clathrus columnatus]
MKSPPTSSALQRSMTSEPNGTEGTLARSATIASVSSVGEFLSRGDVDRECRLKQRWLDAKRAEEARRAEYCAEVRARLEQEEEAKRLSATEASVPDPNLIEWEENDPDNPQYWPFWRKSWITALCCLLTVNVTFASSAPSTTVQAVSQEFHVSLEAAILITSIFLCGYVAGPIIWAPASELIGRRPVFIGTILAYMLLQLGPALGHSFGGLLVTRFLAGLFASAPLTNCGGVIADIWDAVHRGTATALFSGSGWIRYAVISRLEMGFLAHDDIPILLTKRARRLRKQDPEKHGEKYAAAEHADYGPRSLLERTILRPFAMLGQEPILVLITIYLSIIYGLLYSLFSVFPIIWQELRGFNDGEGGLIFIGVGIGTTFGAILSIHLQRHYRELVPKWHGSPPPEERLWGAMYAGPCLIIGIFWLGWTGAFPRVPWLFSASALAANTIFRSAVGAGFPLFTNQMFHSLTIQGACSLIGGVGILLLPIPFVFYKYGPIIREKSKFAPCIDLKIKDEVEQEEKERRRKEQHDTEQSSADTVV